MPFGTPEGHFTHNDNVVAHQALRILNARTERDARAYLAWKTLVEVRNFRLDHGRTPYSISTRRPVQDNPTPEDNLSPDEMRTRLECCTRCVVNRRIRLCNFIAINSPALSDRTESRPATILAEVRTVYALKSLVRRGYYWARVCRDDWRRENNLSSVRSVAATPQEIADWINVFSRRTGVFAFAFAAETHNDLVGTEQIENVAASPSMLTGANYLFAATLMESEEECGVAETTIEQRRDMVENTLRSQGRNEIQIMVGLQDWERITRAEEVRVGNYSDTIQDMLDDDDEEGLDGDYGYSPSVQIDATPTRVRVNEHAYRTKGRRTVGAELEFSEAGSGSLSVIAELISNRAMPSRSVSHSSRFRANAADVTSDSTCWGEVRGPAVTLDKLHNVYGGIVDAMVSDAECVVNRSCGLHLHIGVRGGLGCAAGAPEMTADAIGAALKFYHTHGHLFDEFTTPSRQVYHGAHHSWLRTIPMNDFDAFPKELSRVYNTGHYSVVSTSPLQTKGTIEFRAQAGTLNITKILGWATMMESLVNLAVEENLPNLSSSATAQDLLDGLLTQRGADLGERERDSAKALYAHRTGELILR